MLTLNNIRSSARTPTIARYKIYVHQANSEMAPRMVLPSSFRRILYRLPVAAIFFNTLHACTTALCPSGNKSRPKNP
jgi:hypothetical protein